MIKKRKGVHLASSGKAAKKYVDLINDDSPEAVKFASDRALSLDGGVLCVAAKFLFDLSGPVWGARASLGCLGQCGRPAPVWGAGTSLGCQCQSEVPGPI